MNMQIVFSVDIEGATGIVSTKETREGGIDYQTGREYLTRDVNAAVEGALEGGASRIVIHDSHGRDHRNILLDKLHASAELVRGTPILFFQDIQPGYDACFIVGAHSSYSEYKGILSHFFSSANFRHVRLNGKDICEMEHTAALAGELGIPTALVTGDDIACAEIKRFIPDIEVAVVKQALSRFAARCLPFGRTEPLIRDAARNAVKKVKEKRIPPYTYSGPQTLEIELTSPYHASVISELTKAECRSSTVIFETSGASEVYRLLRLVLYLSWSTLMN
jgi:D-amino peptidase